MTEALLEWVRAHGPAGVFAFIAIENLGIPWPTSLAFLVAIDLVRQGQMTFLAAVGLCTLAHLAGSVVSYAIGCAGDTALMRRLKNGSGLRHALEWLDRWYERHGDATVFGARLIGQVRPWASYAAGLGEVRLAPFVVWTTLGSALQALAALKLAELGFVAWDAFPRLRAAGVIIIAAVFWGAFIYAAWRVIRERRRSSKRSQADR